MFAIVHQGLKDGMSFRRVDHEQGVPGRLTKGLDGMIAVNSRQ